MNIKHEPIQEDRPQRGARWRRVAGIMLALTVAVGTIGFVQLSSPQSATAAVTGAGIEGITPYGGYLGNYIAPDGTRVYCMDSSADWPSGSTSSANLQWSVTYEWGGDIHGSYIEKINYALRKYGQTDDPIQAAAVNAYIYAYTSTYAHFNGPGYSAGANYVNGNSAVLGAYNTIWSDAEANGYTGGSTGTGTASINIVMANSYDGTLTVTTSPANATGTVTLQGATFVSTGTSSANAANGDVLAIKGGPLDDEGKYHITADGTFTAPGGAAQNWNVYYTPGKQRTIAGGTSYSYVFSAPQYVTDPISLVFEPIIGTQVASRFVEPGSSFVDTIAADVAAGSNPWRQLGDGSYVPVVAKGTLYGPFAPDQPAGAASAPADAPVAGTESVTLNGPGSYTSSGSVVATESGYYTWVWSIDAVDQTGFASISLPEDYHFADQFGLVAETHIVPIDLSATSQASASTIGLGASVSDQLSVVLDAGNWLNVDGAPVPAEFTGTAYFVPGDTAPAVSSSVPADAVALTSATITATGPGVYTSSTTATAPTGTAGYVTWVWSLSDSSAWADYFLDWSDQFGLPAETTRVAPPTVATVAVPTAAFGNPVHDTASVGGTLPATTSYLVFEAYLQDGPGAICDTTTLAYTSVDSPVDVTALGSYDSPVTEFEEYGTYFWVESLYSSNDELLHRGECGAEGETTVVSPAEVVTQATDEVEFGQPAHDTATVTGLVPTGATLVFEAYLQNTVDAECTEDTLVFTTAGDPLPLDEEGDYISEATVFTQAGTYYWVETMLDKNGTVLHRGDCGAEGETTVVHPAPAGLAHTGSDGSMILIVGAGGALLLLVGAAILLFIRRRQMGSAE